MTNPTVIRRYSELCKLQTFEDRFNYLKLDGVVGKDTFGYDRYLNQVFYKSGEWKSLRNFLIVRDCGCDLGVDGYEIHGKIYVHHMNPITQDDIVKRSKFLLDPEYLICCSYNTHQAIHYGDQSMIPSDPVDRTPNDTIPWR